MLHTVKWLRNIHLEYWLPTHMMRNSSTQSKKISAQEELNALEIFLSENPV